MNITSLIFRFADALQRKRLVLLKFKSKSDGQVLLRKCAPLDLAPGSKTKAKNYKFHFWDFDSSDKPHVLSLDPDQIIDLDILDDEFQPGDFITWDIATSPWHVKRDWGEFS